MTHLGEVFEPSNMHSLPRSRLPDRLALVVEDKSNAPIVLSADEVVLVFESPLLYDHCRRDLVGLVVEIRFYYEALGFDWVIFT